MQITFDADEARSLMTVLTSYVIDNSGLSADGNARLKTWRSERGEGTPEMLALAAEMNDALGGYLGDKTNRVIRRKGRYTRKGAK